MERQHDNSQEVERLRKEVSMLREEIGRMRHEEPPKHRDNRETKTTNSTSTTKLAKNLSGNAYLESRRKYWREELAKKPLTSTNDVSDKGYVFGRICVILQRVSQEIRHFICSIFQSNLHLRKKREQSSHPGVCAIRA